MISTKDFSALPDRISLQAICRAIATLDAIISPDWESRFYSYNAKWSAREEFFAMQNGEGDQLLVLFREDGCVINGFAPKAPLQEKRKLTRDLPFIFHEFILGEPVRSIGTSFCLWTTEPKNWQVGLIEDYEDHSARLLEILDGNPQTYVDWATVYYEAEDQENSIPLEVVTGIYEGQVLTKTMVLAIVDKVDDWGELQNDLKEIGYPYDFR